MLTVVLPLALLCALAVLDLGLLFLGRPAARWGSARWCFGVAPAGAVLGLWAFAQGFGEGGEERWRLAFHLGLPVFAFLAGLCFLVAAFVCERRGARPLFAAHLAVAVLLGVLSMLALEHGDPLGLSDAGPGARSRAERVADDGQGDGPGPCRLLG